MRTKAKRRKKNNGKKWFKPGEPLNWSKEDSQKRRRINALKSRHGDYLATGRALLALANITKDSETRRKAKSDSEYFFRKYRERKSKKRR